MVRFWFFAKLAIFAILLSSGPWAFADCSSPAGKAGQMLFQSPNFLFCDGTTWTSVSTTGLIGLSCADSKVPMKVSGSWSCVDAVATSTASSVMTRDSSGDFSADDANLFGVVLRDGLGGLATVRAPTGFTSYSLTLPTTDGDSNQVLMTNGSGVLSWTDALTSSSAFVQDGNSFGAAATLGTNDNQSLSLETAGTSRISINSVGGTTFTSNGNGSTGYWNFQNINTGNVSESKINVTSDAGRWVSMGVTSSTFTSTPNFDGQAYITAGAARGLLFSVGSSVSSTNVLKFNTNGPSAANEKMRIDSAGDVGINTTSPNGKLDVKGSIVMSGSTSGYSGFQVPAAAGSMVYTLPASAPTPGQLLSSNASGVLNWATPAGDNLGNHIATQNIQLGSYWLSGDGGNEGLKVSSAGKVSINTSVQVGTSELNVDTGIGINRAGNAPFIDFARDGSSLGQIRGMASNRIGITNSTAANEYFSVRTDTGNVGVGVTSPAERLDVNGGVKIGNSTGANAGTIRWNGTNFQGFNGTTWQNLIVDLPASGSCDSTQVFNSPGTHAYTVPSSFATITVKVWGAGGGGGYYFGTSSTAGGTSSVTSLGLSAGGGGPGQHHTGDGTGAGVGGTASGGTVNTNGNSGTAGTVDVISGSGGSAPNGGGGGGPGVVSGQGQNGATPGGGGGGGAIYAPDDETPAGGGSGGYTEKTFTPATLPTGTTINDIVVGAGGEPGYYPHPSQGGFGGSGQVSITCSTTGSPPANNRGVLFLDSGAYSTDANFVYNASGNLGIGAAPAAGFKLDVAGDARVATLSYSSDERLKRDIASLDDALENILKIDGVSYKWRVDDFPDRNFTSNDQIGLIAQNVGKVYPELITKDDEGFLSVNYPGLIAPLIEAVKSLTEMYNSLFTTELAQNSEIEALKSENEKLKAYLCDKDPNAPFCK